MKRIHSIFIWITFFLVVASFLTTQLTNDFFVFWAYGRAVYNSDAIGIPALLETWELKGLLFKTYMFVNYCLTSKFSTDFGLYCQFMYKLFSLIPFLCIVYLAIYFIPRDYCGQSKRTDFFLISSIFLLSVHFSAHFQAEMWSISFLLLALSLYLHDGVWYKFLSAVIYSLTFYLKTPIPLLGGSLFMGAMLIKRQSVKNAFIELLPFAVTTIVFLGGTLTFLYLYYPQEIIDIWDASYYQPTLVHRGEYKQALIKTVLGLVNKGALYHVSFVIGVLTSIGCIFRWIRNNKWVNSLLLLFMWLFPLMYITLSNCFFEYHYYLLLYPTLISIFVFVKDWNIKSLKKLYITYTLSILYLLYYFVALSSFASSNISAKSFYSQTWHFNESGNYYVGCKLDGGDVLFLDSGTGSFVFSNHSYLRYFYPLPLQRISDGDPFKGTDTYKRTKRKVMEYKGKYVVSDDNWFYDNGNIDVKDKIEREYELIAKVAVPYFSWNLFEDENVLGYLHLYKKKGL